MRTCLVLVVMSLGCSDAKKQEPAPSSATAEPKRPVAPTPDPVAPPAAAPAAKRNAANAADLTLGGEWERTLKGTGVSCTIRTEGREIDKGIEIKLDTRTLELGTPHVTVTLKRKLDKPEATLVQVDVEADAAAPGRPKYSLYGRTLKGASITKAEIADDGSSAVIDATLGSSKNDGKTVRLTGTITCGDVVKSNW